MLLGALASGLGALHLKQLVFEAKHRVLQLGQVQSPGRLAPDPPEKEGWWNKNPLDTALSAGLGVLQRKHCVFEAKTLALHPGQVQSPALTPGASTPTLCPYIPPRCCAVACITSGGGCHWVMLVDCWW
jgi:hypothetical protein